MPRADPAVDTLHCPGAIAMKQRSMKLRLLTTLLAAAALSACATYDYAGGSGAGGYYHGRPSVDYYGPYGNAYGYPSYGYPGYGYGQSRYGYGSRYYGSYGGYHPYRPHYPRPPRHDHDGDDHDGDDHDGDDDRGDRPPPWRAPDGRYQDTGQVMIPPRDRGQMLDAPSQPIQAGPSRPMAPPRPSNDSEAPGAERARPMQQAQRERATQQRPVTRDRLRTEEE